MATKTKSTKKRKGASAKTTGSKRSKTVKAGALGNLAIPGNIMKKLEGGQNFQVTGIKKVAAASA